MFSSATNVTIDPAALVRTDADIKKAVNAWCKDPVAAELEFGHISLWNTNAVTDTRELFVFKVHFNDDISQWDVENVTNMHGMFMGASSFNQPLEQWDVKKVTDMEGMFSDASSFNQDISQWQVSEDVNMDGMWDGASSMLEKHKPGKGEDLN